MKKMLSILMAFALLLCSNASAYAQADETQDGTILRHEFVGMLHSALGIHIMYLVAPDITRVFDDVTNEDFYADDLYDLSVTDIIDDEKQFRPNDILTKEEMVHYIMNALQYKAGGRYTIPDIEPKPFEDQADMNTKYLQDIINAQKLQIISRGTDSMFHPKAEVTYAEVKKIIDNLLNKLKAYIGRVSITPYAEIREGKLNMKLTITNGTVKTFTINHPTRQKYDFEILDKKSNVIYRWSTDKCFACVLTDTVIQPGQSVEFSYTLTDEELNSLNTVPLLMKAYIKGTSEQLEISPDGGFTCGVKRIYD